MTRSSDLTKAEREMLASGRVNTLPDPVYGGQLQDLGIPGHVAEGRIHTIWEEEPVLARVKARVIKRGKRSVVAYQGQLRKGPAHVDRKAGRIEFQVIAADGKFAVLAGEQVAQLPELCVIKQVVDTQ